MLLASAGWYIKLTYSGSSRLIREAVNLFAKCISSRFSRNIYKDQLLDQLFLHSRRDYPLVKGPRAQNGGKIKRSGS